MAASLLLLGEIGAPAEPGEAVVVAVVDGHGITDSKIDFGMDQGFRVASQRYHLARRTLDERIDKLLMAREAAAQGTTTAALVDGYVRANTRPVTDADVRAVLADRGEPAEGQAEDGVRRALTDSRSEWAIRKLKKTLRVRAKAVVLLDGPRAQFDLSGAPAMGKMDARVTMVVFSATACSASQRFMTTTAHLLERYPRDLRVVHRDAVAGNGQSEFEAAEAARCAGEQGKFWEVRQRIVDQNVLTPAAYLRYAREEGLDVGVFEECIATHRQHASVRNDVAEAERYGVSGTPTVFVNGRMLLDAPTEELLADAIEEELAVVAGQAVQGS